MEFKDLKLILSWIRPANSTQEENFVLWLVERIRNLGYEPVQDGFGNVWVEHQNSSTLFTAHTDTCHSVRLVEQFQNLLFDEELGIASLENPEHGYVLGADDGTGIWVMLQMLQAQVPASFVFYREEEVGGRGSHWSATNEPDRYARYNRAVSFDRKENHSIITHQGGGRCCSEEFSDALGLQLEPHGVEFRSDTGGTFADSANLTDLVGECTNLSVGYNYEHSCSEYQDLSFLQTLVPALIKVDWESLPTQRKPGEVESLYAKFSTSGSDPWSWYTNEVQTTNLTKYVDQQFEDSDVNFLDSLVDNLVMYGEDFARELVYDSPEEAVELLLYLAR